ncbi:MAG: hypothetical protein ACRDPT_15920 [Streptomycetales bacterium]
MDGALGFVEPKTYRSRRSLPIPSSVLPALERHRARQAAERLVAGEVWQEHDLVFTTGIGTPVEPPERQSQVRRAA